jgi:hypothetical protein
MHKSKELAEIPSLRFAILINLLLNWPKPRYEH